ncbi:K(+)-transporting ATPase subunit F [Crenobacter caeni]|uniref:K(+)-transporting ATPase subunit F n=1 Tax=Crenobacter caeni TaxID=2705474 RepID=A0A6B2KT67_9NEIS|nr:K(+)-transporting ATPase subunit F [Crenobacter caeni]NDV13250.1 K(+)-transporting ATPase subunit F [Crenobacter caeni]
MNLMMWLSGAMALGLGVWLVYALLNAEDI